MSKATNIFAFIAGAAIGSLVTWQFVKKKYERIAQEEIDSVKEVYSARYSAKHEEEPAEEQEDDEMEITSKYVKPDLGSYASAVKESGYDYPVEKTEERNAERPNDKPYVITPEEYDCELDYDKICLMYYADQILADDMDQIVHDVESLVGIESLTHFGEYEPDTVLVRNDAKRCDYEICRSARTYLEVIAQEPYKADLG